MGTTVGFANPKQYTKNKKITGGTTQIYATEMSLIRVPNASQVLGIKKTSVVYAEDTGRFYIGGEGKAISSLLVLPSFSSRPVKGSDGILYASIQEKALSVWDNATESYVDFQQGGSSHPSVIVVDNSTKLPAIPQENVFYISKDKKGYIYDASLSAYIPVFDGDVYTTTQADTKFAKINDVYSITQADQTFVKKSDVSGGGAYSDIALQAKITQLETELNNVKAELQSVQLLAADDYEDVFIVGSTPQTEFSLTHKPIGKLRLYINGLHYTKSTWSYDESTNKVTWIFTEDKGGFNIKNTEVVFEYDYNSGSVNPGPGFNINKYVPMDAGTTTGFGFGYDADGLYVETGDPGVTESSDSGISISQYVPVTADSTVNFSLGADNDGLFVETGTPGAEESSESISANKWVPLSTDNTVDFSFGLDDGGMYVVTWDANEKIGA